MVVSNKKTDKQGYDVHYKGKASSLLTIDNPGDYVKHFERVGLSPFCRGGGTKGYVRGLTVSRLMSAAEATGKRSDQLTILDAGCGLGELSTYLACRGFDVVGVDISVEACRAAEHLATKVGVSDKCTFLAESLERLSVSDASIDFVIGHAALHHFIKYEGVPGEFHRVLKAGSKGFFADSFGENRLFHIFHDKEKMERLGDVILSKKAIVSYFQGFDVELVATDWFVMLDKFYLKLLSSRRERLIRQLSRIHFRLDRWLPRSNRVALFLSGSVMTIITKL